jgi:hypothetical protein
MIGTRRRTVLYELRAYRTQRYDRSTERRARFSDCPVDRSKVEAWVVDYLTEFHDGKVVVDEITGRFLRTRRRRVFSATNQGRVYG